MPKRVWITGLLVAVGALLTMCGMQVVSLFGFLQERQTIAVELMEDFAGDPNATLDTLPMSELLGRDNEGFDQLVSLMPRLGTFQSAETPNCNWNSYAGTEQANGEYVDCSGVARFEEDPTVGYTFGWRKEEGEWKVYNFMLTSERFLADAEPSDQADKDKPKAESKD